jgi:hypothetical protein
MNKLFFCLALSVMIIFLSCKKSHIDQPASLPTGPTAPLVTAVGTPDGVATSRLIVAATGGTITSADGKIIVNIPAGALSKNETITIQPVTNTTGLGKSKAYRITPHGVTFNKPVAISFRYTEADITGTVPELLRIAFQDSARIWQSMNQTQVVRQNKQLTVTTTHFSDWTVIPLVHIEPAEARIALNETIELKVIYSYDPEEIFVPLAPVTPLTQPQISSKFVKKWQHSGSGTLTADGAKAVYKAPDKAPAQNPVAINAEISFGQGQPYSVVANVTILSDFHIDYLQVDETELSTPQLTRGSQLFIYGNFGNDPGVNKRSVKVGNVGLVVKVWTPKMIICEITSEGPTSSGIITVTAEGQSSSKLLNEWLVDFYYEKKESPDGQLTKKIKFVLRFRGDAMGYGSGETSPFLEYTDINKSSKAMINMPAGSYSNAVTVDACGVYNVKWGAVNHVTERSLYAKGDGFNGRLFQTPTGFGVKIKFLSDDILKSTRTFSPCIGSVYSTVVNEPIGFQGYHEQTIWFPFASASERTPIKAGPAQIQTGTGVAPGLFWDAIDVNASIFTTKIWWDEARPKYD